MNKFIIDECTGPKVAFWLKEKGFDTYSVTETSPGITDDEILQIAVKENRILITNDKDFGELIFKNRIPHKGVIFLRLLDESSTNKIIVLEKLFDSQPPVFINEHSFVVVTEKSIRINRI